MILNSWKEIASYLHCSVRTAQRLEGEGMPVRRPAGHLRSAVVAFSEEIEIWLQSAKTERPSDGAPVFRPSERGVRIGTQLTALRQQMAECRQRSTELRERAIQIRARRRFTAPFVAD